ncbi:hypothetical protein DM02DRAFT_613426 [Periconia macrospinosa]|uniref:C6 transcription factor n=1 Tax=Periconia macrospinosa TaxID=97972 RepID=A0A2V1DTS4_9PLEO|nr:hypothetical protein DM02DRAFT_613426 [Periconia macrospinosa]
MPFACSVIIFEFGTQQICPHAVFDYMSILHVLRMSAHVARLVDPFLRRSVVWQYIRNSVSADLRLLEESLRATLRLKRAIHSSLFLPQHERDVLLEAAQTLEECILHCIGSSCVWEHYIRFPHSTPADYFNLLAAENDLALLILIHWCAVMHRVFKRWFLQKWPQRAVGLAMARLSGQWTDLLTWPCLVFGCSLTRPSAIEHDGNPDPTVAGTTKSPMLGAVADADPDTLDMGFVHEYC